MITCYVQYELNPSKIPEFEEYARAWIPLVEKFGGMHHGYYLPHESPNDLAVCLFSFPSLAEYEAYRIDSLTDSDCQKAYQFAEDIRDDWCADPATMPDSELAGIAAWAWKCRLENRIYRGRDSAFPVQRLALDALRGLANGTDAIALLVLLQDQHGHSPGKRFPLDFKAMLDAGLINLSIPRLREARRALERAGLLRLVGKHLAGSRPQTFVLTRMRANLADAESLPAQSTKVRGKAGGRV